MHIIIANFCTCMQLMESGSAGLLLNERLLNCPPQLGPPLQQALFDEILWATEDEPTEVSFTLILC